MRAPAKKAASRPAQVRHPAIGRKVSMQPGAYVEEDTGDVWVIEGGEYRSEADGRITKTINMRHIAKDSIPPESPEPDMPPPQTAKNLPALDPIRKRITMDYAVLMKKHLNLDTVPTAMLDEMKELFEVGMSEAIRAASSTSDRISRINVTGALQAMMKRADEHSDETIEMAPGVWKYAVKEMLTKLEEI